MASPGTGENNGIAFSKSPLTADKMEDTYEAWEANAEKGLQLAARPGVVVRKVDIDVEELVKWCRSQSRAVDGAARAIFTAEKLKEQSEKNQ